MAAAAATPWAATSGRVKDSRDDVFGICVPKGWPSWRWPCP